MMMHTLGHGHDRTEIVCEWHFHPDEMAKPTPGVRCDRVLGPNDREDWWISEQSRPQLARLSAGAMLERGVVVELDEIVRREATTLD
jgi:hypothetical protein